MNAADAQSVGEKIFCGRVQVISEEPSEDPGLCCLCQNSIWRTNRDGSPAPISAEIYGCTTSLSLNAAQVTEFQLKVATST